jgi:nucleotide-binding universal stress UspA family protein
MSTAPRPSAGEVLRFLSPPDIRKVGAAITMQPHADALIVEASRFADRLDATLTLIHTWTSRAEKSDRLDEITQRLGISHEAHVIEGTVDPAVALLRDAENAGIELLVAGAFEGLALKRRRFLSPTARQLTERSRCSLLLLAHPRLDAHDFKRIVVITDFSECARQACAQALWLAEKDAAEFIEIVSVHTVFMKARAELGRRDQPARTRAEEEQLLANFVAALPPCSRPVSWKVIDAGTGFAACDYAEAVEADVLVLPGRNRPGGRVPSFADWVLQVVPCSLWIVHEGPAWT